MLDIKLKLKPGHSSQRAWMEPSSLRALFWNVTYACNYRCSICFTDSSHAHQRELDTKEAEEAIHAIHSAGIRDVLISGGEPFMRPDMTELLKKMAQHKIATRIASNGSLLNDEILDQLRGETLTRSFQISLDSLDPDVYGRFHGCSGKNLAKVLDVIDSIQKRGFHTTVSTRLTEETLEGMPHILDMASEKGWSTVTIHVPVHMGRSQITYAQDQDVLSLLEPVLEHFCNLPSKWLMETYIPWAQYHRTFKKLAGRVAIVHRGCRAGRDRLTINPTGALSPCVCMDIPDAHVGNVRHDDLREVFEKATVCNMLRHPAQYGICGQCQNLARCGGGCRASAHALTGKIDGQDEACPVWKKRDQHTKKVR